MSRHLYIAGVGRISDLEKGSLRIEQALTYQIDTCSFSVKGEQPAEGEEVIVEDDELGRLFAGIIVKVELARTFPSKTIKVWQVECDDYTALLDRRLVVETYEDTPADVIFRDIANLYCPDFTANGVHGDAPSVEYIRFDYMPPSECFRQLCDYIGWHWQPDYYKDLHFFNVDTFIQPAPMILEPGGYFRDLRHRVDTLGLRNRVYVLGGRFLSDPQTFEYVSDGKQRAWVVPYEPHSPWVSVQEGPLIKPGLEHVDDEAEYAWMYNQKEKVIRCSSQTSTPIAGATVAFTFKFPMDVISMVEDIESQQALAAIQGGDGVYEHKLVEESLITLEAAEAAGLADLREHANPKVSGSFETEVNGWRPGQIVTIDLPDRGVTGEYLIQKVTITPTWSEPSIWTYYIEYGGRLIGIPDLLKALVSAQVNKQVVDVKYQTKFETGEDQVRVVDSFIAEPRTQPWYCGDEDAICGEIVCLGVV